MRFHISVPDEFIKYGENIPIRSSASFHHTRKFPPRRAGPEPEPIVNVEPWKFLNQADVILCYPVSLAYGDADLRDTLHLFA